MKNKPKQEKYWLRVSYGCNNRCLFCLDHESQKDVKNKFLPLNDLKDKMLKARINNFDKLILSGGEPTIHPEINEIASKAKELGFKRIQIITNGRMLSYKSFLNDLVNSGVNEITLSVHGIDAKTYDKLTNTQNALAQVFKALVNLKSYPKIIKNIDIVITKHNYQDILRMINFYSSFFNIYEYDLLWLIPFGRAWENWDDLYIEPKEAFEKGIKPVLDLARTDKRFHVWTNRFPEKYLKGYEEYIQNPIKIMDEVRGRRQMFLDYINNNTDLYCYNVKRCQFCPLNEFCKEFIKKARNKGFDLNNFTEKYIKQKQRILSTPDRLEIYLTFKCNNNCIFCSEYKNRDNYGNQEFFTPESFELLLEKYSRKKIKHITFLGGEPFLCSNILKFLKLSKKHNFKTAITSNGLMLSNRKFAKEVLVYVDELVLSIQSADEQTILKMSQNQRACQNLPEALENIKKYFKGDLLKVSTVITSENFQDLSDLILFVKKWGITELTFNSLDISPENKKYLVSLSKIKEKIPEWIKIAKTNQINLKFGELPLCILGDNINNSENFNFDNRINLSPEGIELDRGKIPQRQMLKTYKCKQCKLYDECLGINKEYFDIKGDQEINPIN